MNVYHEFLTGLRTQLQAGVPLKQALSILGRTRKCGGLADEVLRFVDDGSTLAEAMSRATAIEVPPAHVALLDAGERSGRLTELLGKVVADLAAIQELRSTLWTRSLYPLAVICAAVVLPPIGLLLSDHSDEYLRIQLSFFGPLALVVVLWRLRERIAPRSSALRVSLQNILRAVPIFGRFLVEHALSRSLGVLGLMLEAGLGFAESLPIVGRSSGWIFLEREFKEIDEKIVGGANATEALCMLTALPEQFHSVIASGEVSGTLDRALRICADGLRDTTTTRVDRMLRLLPVVAMLVAGLVVGYIVVSFWRPLLSL